MTGALPNDPKANNSTSVSKFSLLSHSGDLRVVGRESDDGTEKASRNSICPPSTPPQQSSQPHTPPLLVTNFNLTNTQFPETDTGTQRVQRHMACHTRDKKLGLWLHFYPQGTRGQDPFMTVAVFAPQALLLRAGHLNQKIWKEPGITNILWSMTP